MDPLDKILSMIVLKTIQVVKEERVVEHHPEHNNAKKSGTNRLWIPIPATYVLQFIRVCLNIMRILLLLPPSKIHKISSMGLF